MKKDYCDITVVLDRSGSMQSIKSDTIGGFNAFLKEQQQVQGEATISLFQFDTEYETVYEGRPVASAPELTNDTFQPRGMTALLDAIGRTINSVGRRLANLQENDRPEKVVFVIITDGEENSSREFKIHQISDLIEHQKNVYKWEFVFLGANQDAIATASQMGISAQHALTYVADSQGAPAAFAAYSRNVARYRQGEVMDAAFTAEDREEQERAGLEPKSIRK